MQNLTPSQQKILEYLHTHKKPVGAQFLADYFMLSYTTTLKALRIFKERGEIKLTKVGHKKLYRISE